jgi:hypothetical protein
MPLRDNGHHKDKLAEIFAMQHDAPVSSILLQENRFSPLPAAGFFFAFNSPAASASARRLWCTIEPFSAPQLQFHY